MLGDDDSLLEGLCLLDMKMMEDRSQEITNKDCNTHLLTHAHILAHIQNTYKHTHTHTMHIQHTRTNTTYTHMHTHNMHTYTNLHAHMNTQI